MTYWGKSSAVFASANKPQKKRFEPAFFRVKLVASSTAENG
jgi:hypothetical protein